MTICLIFSELMDKVLRVSSQWSPALTYSISLSIAGWLSRRMAPLWFPLSYRARLRWIAAIL
ncbi:hypothetical protein [Paenibacillus donghaensis]|uniref:hypothetical protein n=1 Tax=Paenibacillus donghaensis TaxID=414771 RepID=UPI0014717E61|nr:hypothetical protein [Paenibacillus donghaensis]